MLEKIRTNKMYNKIFNATMATLLVVVGFIGFIQINEVSASSAKTITLPGGTSSLGAYNPYVIGKDSPKSATRTGYVQGDDTKNTLFKIN